jgi:1-acyl-sn-glycerol-3-phosphate acyltransferase
LFPEGASGNGDRVLPFKSALFRAAVLAEVPVVSICIQYRMIDQQPVNSKNRDEIYYYGEQKFGAQFFKSMKLKQIEVVLEEAGVVAASKGSGNHKSIAAQSYESICSRFERIQS